MIIGVYYPMLIIKPQFHQARFGAKVSVESRYLQGGFASHMHNWFGIQNSNSRAKTILLVNPGGKRAALIPKSICTKSECNFFGLNLNQTR